MDLIQEIVKAVGVNEAQAKGGAGLLFKMAKDKLASGDFASLSAAIPQVNELIKSAPSGSGGGGLLGAVTALGGAKLGGLASMAGALSSLKLDPQTLSKFAPVILEFVKQKAGPEMATKLANLLPIK